mgnify:CR=1 FL=1
MGVLASGRLREWFAIESPTETRNDVGELVQTWEEVGRVFGSYEALSYNEQARRGQIGGTTSGTVMIRYYPGLLANWRLVWLSRGGRTLYISGVVEQGFREAMELSVEEAAT